MESQAGAAGPSRTYGPVKRNVAEVKLRYGTFDGGALPRLARLEVPGWAGEAAMRADGSAPQPWHCKPFVDATTFGFELVFERDEEFVITSESNSTLLYKDGRRLTASEGFDSPNCPFSRFAPYFYGLALFLYLDVPEDYVLRIEPHPRFFTDRSGTVPIAVPGHIDSFWPRSLFVVFKTPAVGHRHVFTPKEPFAQVVAFPRANLSLEKMPQEMIADRRRRDGELSKLSWVVARNVWFSACGTWFDDKYRRLQKLYRTKGSDAVKQCIHGDEE